MIVSDEFKLKVFYYNCVMYFCKKKRFVLNKAVGT